MLLPPSTRNISTPNFTFEAAELTSDSNESGYFKPHSTATVEVLSFAWCLRHVDWEMKACSAVGLRETVQLTVDNTCVVDGGIKSETNL
jgi:hypothetical protein